MRVILDHIQESPLTWAQNPTKFFEFVEAVCLFDEVFVLQGWDDVQITEENLEQSMIDAFNETDFSFFSTLDSLLNACKGAGAITIVGPNSLAKRADAKTKKRVVQNYLGSMPNKAQIAWAAGVILDASPVFAASDIDPLNAVSKKRQEWQHLLQDVYAQLSHGLREEVSMYDRLSSLYVPPLPAMLLSNVGSRDEIPAALLTIRKRCENLRKIFEEYEKAMRDRLVPLKEKEHIGSRLKELGLAITGGKSVVGVTCYPWRDFKEFLGSIMELADEELDALYKNGGLKATKILKSLAGVPFEMIVNHLKFRRFSYLFQLSHEYRSRGSAYDLRYRKLFG